MGEQVRADAALGIPAGLAIFFEAKHRRETEVGNVAPTIAEVADPKVFATRNAAVIRNTAIVNFFDLCAISLPLPAKPPVGLMLVARNGADRRLLCMAAAVAQLFGA